MDEIKPYEAIPFVKQPANFPIKVGPFLASCYAQYGPIFRSTDFGHEVVYLVGPEANRFVLVSHREFFSHHQGFWFVEEKLGHGLLSMDDPEHAHHRSMMNPAFTFNYMNHYLPIMQKVIGQRTARWVEREEIDLYEEARKITFDITTEALTGLQVGAEVDHFRDLFFQLLMLGAVAPTADLSERQEFVKRETQLKGQLFELLLSKIKERRKQAGDDLLSLLIRVRDDQGQSPGDEQIIAHINIMLVAGHETSTSLSAWLFYLLTQHPDYLQRVLAEQQALLGPEEILDLESIKKMKVLEYALNETERLYPPIAHGPRGVLEDVKFNGYHIPAGTQLYYSIAASHLLPEVFADPARFDPDRFAPPREEQKKVPYALVGFGGGPRMCIGINFAKVEIKALASYVLRRYRLELVPDQEIVLFYRTTATGMPRNGIRMRVSKLAVEERKTL